MLREKAVCQLPAANSQGHTKLLFYMLSSKACPLHIVLWRGCELLELSLLVIEMSVLQAKIDALRTKKGLSDAKIMALQAQKAKWTEKPTDSKFPDIEEYDEKCRWGPF